LETAFKLWFEKEGKMI